MAKANLTLPDGTTVNIEGSADEVATLLSRFSDTGGTTSKRATKKKAKKRRAGNTSGKTTRKKKGGPTSFITELVDEGYFKSRRTIADIRKKLEERGHIYPATSISPVLTRLTRKKVLRRLKDKKGWVYVA